MIAKRSTYVHTLRGSAGIIFGFPPEFFTTDFDRSKVPEFQALLGVKNTAKGPRYPVLPPILYPDGNYGEPTQLFLNPALVKVSILSDKTCLYCRLTHM